MSESVASGRVTKRRRAIKSNPKLPTLPKDAKVTKRPLLHPVIPSPYSGSAQQKVIYISAKTPFISAVKRAEKLLRLGDKRLVQSATKLNKDAKRRGEDVIVGIAREVEKRKGNEKKEEVVFKGTGKAIGKAMELGLWFQQREEYCVRLSTGSVGAVDDVEYQEGGGNDIVGGAEEEAPEDMEAAKTAIKPASRVVKREEQRTEDGKTEVNETRIRQLSVLEVHVCLR